MNRIILFVIGLAVIVPAFAHHSAAAEYDFKNLVTLTGTVTKVEWMNPHARFYAEVKDADGKVSTWEFQTGSPNQLLRMGWKRDSLKVGEVVTVDAYRAKDGDTLGDAQSITLSNGRKILAGSGDGAPSKQGEAKPGDSAPTK